MNSYGEYVSQLREKLQQGHDVARKHIHTSAKRQKDNYDHRLNFNKYQPGDVVWCKTGYRKEGICAKLQSIYSGPFMVSKCLSPLCYQIMVNQEGKTMIMNHDKMVMYKGNKPPGWVLPARQKLPVNNI